MRSLACLAAALVVSFATPTFAQQWDQRAPGTNEYEGRPIGSIKFRGNKKAEDDAIRVAIRSQVGEKLSADQLRDDIRGVWKLGFFEDVQIEAVESGGKIDVVFVLREKPVIRKIYVSGAKEVGLDKINEVLDIKRDTIIDPAKVKRNVEKVRDLYVEKGYYLAEVTSDIQRKDDQHVDVYLNVDEHAKVEVRQIRFLGNEHLKDEEVRSAMGTQEGGWLSFITSSGTYREDAFDRDLLLITAFYYDRGYINVKIGKPEIELSGDKQFLYITIPIEEGEPYKIGKIDFKGDLLLPKDEYYRRMATHPGEMFNRSKLGSDIQKLNDIYKDTGYAYVNILPQTAIDAVNRTVDVVFDVQKGNQVYFGKINIRGNTKTRDKVIRRELRVFEGELYNQTRLDRSKRLVTALGFFEKVELSTKAVEGTNDKIDVNIEVTERATGTFQIGAGFSSVENFIGQAQVSQNNLFGRGTTMQLQAQISSLRQLFTLRYLDPYFLDTRLTFAFSVYNSLLFYPSFNRTARGGDLTWGYLFGDYLRVFGTYKLEYVDVQQNQAGLTIGGFAPSTQVSPGTVSNLFRSGFTSSIRLSLNYDSRDDRMFPKNGMFHSIAVEVADPLIASQAVYTRINGWARFYKRLWGPFVFRLNVEAGLVTSRDSQGVPIYERYFLGGINTIRGFQLFSLGPKVNVLSQQEPSAFLSQFNIGGNLQLIMNSEIEFPIFQAVQIKGVIFFDAGNAYNTELSKYCPSALAVSNIPDVFNPCNQYPTFSNLRYSVGFGFRWNSPIGPLRFEWGIPLNRQVGEDPIVFEFTIGNFF
ncbi:MAG: outer membrane protein assembly complex, YaeT protein [Myxococcales bacterium]|nr:outer membrane protein assembly complex, YaeT protein [Myxococcales bacterium]